MLTQKFHIGEKPKTCTFIGKHYSHGKPLQKWKSYTLMEKLNLVENFHGCRKAPHSWKIYLSSELVDLRVDHLI